jgi:hypothetical protein
MPVWFNICKSINEIMQDKNQMSISIDAEEALKKSNIPSW